VLLTSDIRKVQESTNAYGQWLQQLREICSACDVPLIFDEVYTDSGSLRAEAQEYFGIQADIVVYGKTVGGGMPIDVCAGAPPVRRPTRNARCAWRTWSAPSQRIQQSMGAMNEFLRWATLPATATAYDEMNAACAGWVAGDQCVSRRSGASGASGQPGDDTGPLMFKEPGRFNWLLQYIHCAPRGSP
jgi:glutamate-1-semialdehyde 2,1-aminomutase